MINQGRWEVLGVKISAVDYDGATEAVIDAALQRRPLAVTALAVHGVMTCALDPEHRYRLNRFALSVPDGQQVRWALKLLLGKALPDRVTAPLLMVRVCCAAAEQGLSIFLFGSTREVLDASIARLSIDMASLRSASAEPSAFRRLSEAEHGALDARIRASSADIIFVGLGCPRQEVFVYEHTEAVSRPLLAVGAAFDFFAGRPRRAPGWMQRTGREWLFRFAQGPRRLWQQYIVLNPLFLLLLTQQKLGLFRDNPERRPTREVQHG